MDDRADVSMKAKLALHAWKDRDKALYDGTFSAVKPKGDKIKSKWKAVLYEELLDLDGSQEAHSRASQQRPRRIQDHPLLSFLRSTLHLGMRSIEGLLTSLDDAI